MRSIEEIIDKLYESSNHGTRREDVVAAYNAGIEEALFVLGEDSERLMRDGCRYEATVVECAAENIEKVES